MKYPWVSAISGIRIAFLNNFFSEEEMMAKSKSSPKIHTGYLVIGIMVGNLTFYILWVDPVLSKSFPDL